MAQSDIKKKTIRRNTTSNREKIVTNALVKIFKNKSSRLKQRHKEPPFRERLIFVLRRNTFFLLVRKKRGKRTGLHTDIHTMYIYIYMSISSCSAKCTNLARNGTRAVRRVAQGCLLVQSTSCVYVRGSGR